MVFRSVILAIALALAACDSGKAPVATPAPKPDCARLDTLLGGLSTVQHLLDDTAQSWAAVKPPLDELLEGIHVYLNSGSADCHFLNQKLHPEVERFAFVEALRRRIVRDTLSDGIYYLVRFRGLFPRDKEIAEFFSEEIAHVAYRNPEAFVSYLRRDPGQKEMLLNTTRWTVFNTDTLSARFGRTPGGEGVKAFIEGLAASKEEPVL